MSTMSKLPTIEPGSPSSPSAFSVLNSPVLPSFPNREIERWGKKVSPLILFDEDGMCRELDGYTPRWGSMGIDTRGVYSPREYVPSTTVGIPGRLPNAVYTLIPSTIMAILKASNVREETYFMCKKFLNVSKAFNEQRETFEDEGTILTLNDGRIFSEGNNLTGNCGVDSDRAFLARPHWVRLPAVSYIWQGHGRWYAETVTGLYAWGRRSLPKLLVPFDVEDISIFDNATFIKVPAGWLAYGDNSKCQLGLGHGMSPVTEPVLVPDSETILRWYSACGSTFAWTEDELLFCGSAFHDVWGIADRVVIRPTHVTLPIIMDGLTIDEVISHSGSTFFRCGERCFVSGYNHESQLGVPCIDPSEAQPIVELPIPVSGVTINSFTTVIHTNHHLLACGDNSLKQISPKSAQTMSTTPIAFQWPVVHVVVGVYALFVKRDDDIWFARGFNASGRLGIGKASATITDWYPVALRGIKYILSYAYKGYLFVTEHGIYSTGIMPRTVPVKVSKRSEVSGEVIRRLPGMPVEVNAGDQCRAM